MAIVPVANVNTNATAFSKGEIMEAYFSILANDQAQRPPPETPGRLQQSRTNYPNRPTDKRGGGSMQRTC